MFAGDTLDTIGDASTLVSRGVQDVVSRVLSYTAATQYKSDDLSHRRYSDACMTGVWSGYRDSKNTSLYIDNDEVQTLASVVANGNKCAGDWRRETSMASYNGHRRVKRKWGVEDSQPVGCNGPVVCTLGLKMRDVIVAHNNDLPVLAAKASAFGVGGVSNPHQDKDVSKIGAGYSVPTNGPDGSRLNNAVGLDYAINITPGKAILAMQRKNFVGGVANGTAGQ